MTGQEIKGRLDRIGKTVLEHFKDIEELEVADGPEITVEDIVPYKCKQVEKSLKALEIIKEKNVDVDYFLFWSKQGVLGKVEDYNQLLKHKNGRCQKLPLTQEEFETVKEVLQE